VFVDFIQFGPFNVIRAVFPALLTREMAQTKLYLLPFTLFVTQETIIISVSQYKIELIPYFTVSLNKTTK